MSSKVYSRRRAALAISTVFLLLASACGGDGDSASTDGEPSDAASVEDYGLGSDTVQAAQEEGTVVAGATILNQEIFDELAAAFEDRYDIDVQFESTGAAAAAERIRTEARGDQVPSFDTIQLGAYFLEQLSQDELLESFRPTDFDEESLLEAESEDYFPLVTNVYGIGVNRSLVDDSDAPESWEDVPSIETEAPVLMHDPSDGAGGYIWFATMLDAPDYGEPYLRDVGDLPNLQLGSVIADNVSGLVRGEYAAYFPFPTISISDIEGTDVEFVAPSEGPIITPINAGLVEGAAHPNAARLWLSYMWSKEGQEILAEGAQAPIRADAESPDPRWDLSETSPLHVVNNEYLLEHLADLETGLPGELGIG